METSSVAHNNVDLTKKQTEKVHGNLHIAESKV